MHLHYFGEHVVVTQTIFCFFRSGFRMRLWSYGEQVAAPQDATLCEAINL